MQRVWHASRGRLPFWTPYLLGLAYAPIAETSFSEFTVPFLDFHRRYIAFVADTALNNNLTLPYLLDFHLEYPSVLSRFCLEHSMLWNLLWHLTVDAINLFRNCFIYNNDLSRHDLFFFRTMSTNIVLYKSITFAYIFWLTFYPS